MDSFFDSVLGPGAIAPDNNSSDLQTDPNFPASLPDPDLTGNPFARFSETVAEVMPTIEPSKVLKGPPVPFEAVEKYKGTSTYNPYMSPYGNSAKIAADNWSMWDAVATGLSGLTDNAINAGKEYAYGWVRAGRAFANFDTDYLKPSQAETELMAYQQEMVSRENPIYFDPGKEDDIFTRATMAEFLQNTGFTFGTLGGFMAETAIMGGIGKLGTKLPQLFKAGALSSSKRLTGSIPGLTAQAQKYQTLDDYISNIYGTGVFTGKTVFDNAMNVASKLPIIGAVADAGKVLRAGAAMSGAGTIGLTASEVARIGAGGLKRAFSEWNFAASEAAIEAGGTYGEVYDMLYDMEVRQNGGALPTPEAIQRIRDKAMQASTTGYNTNFAVLAVMNKVQFGNLFRNFGTDSKFLNLLRNNTQRVITVSGVDKGGNEAIKHFTRNYLGILGHRSEIVNTFGKGVFYRELGRDIVRGAGRFEISEGIQENIQEGTNEYLKSYYADLYNDDVASWSASFKEAFESQTTKRGFKTFLQGALTGFAIRPVTGAMEATRDYLRKRSKTDDPSHVDALQATLDRINVVLSKPEDLLKENHRTIKEQILLNEGMTQGAANGNKYQYLNNKESAIIRLALDTKRVGTFDAVMTHLSKWGQSVDAQEFKEATGIDLQAEGISSPSEYMDKLVGKLKRYSDIYDNYNQMFENYLSYEAIAQDDYSKQRFSFAQAAIRDAIHIAAFNQAKAENGIQRSADIAKNVASVRGIGQSAAANFNNVTDYDLAAQQITIIENEIKTLREAGPLDAQTEKLIQLKEQEKQALIDWNENAYEALVTAREDAQETTYSPLDKMKMTDAQRKNLTEILGRYYQAKNAQSGVKAPIVNTDLESVLDSINDYQKLDRDVKDYFNAVNLLSDPENMLRAAQAYEDSRVAAYARLLHDTYTKLAEESGIFADYIRDNPTQMENLLRLARSPFASHDSIAAVMQAATKINQLGEEDVKERIAAAEFAMRPGAPINVKALQNIDPRIVTDFIATHYEENYVGDEFKGIRRFYMDDKNVKQVTHTISIDDIVKFFNELSGNELTPDNITGMMLSQYARYFEQSLFYAENPKAAVGDEDRIWQKELILQETKKLYNLLGSRVLYLGQSGVLEEDGKDYFVQLDDGNRITLGAIGPAALVRFQWTLDPDGEYVLTEVDSPDFLSTDNYPYLHILGDNMTEQEKELTGESLEAIAVRVADQAYKVDQYKRDETGESITIGGNEYRVTRDVDNAVVTMIHDFAEGRVVFTAEKAQRDPDGIDNKYIAIANIMYIRSMDVLDEEEVSEEQLNAAVDMVDNMSPIVDTTITPVTTVKRRTRERKTNLPAQGAIPVEQQASYIVSDFPEDLIKPIQDMLSSMGERVEGIGSDTRAQLFDWAVDTVEKLNKLDPDNEEVIDYISLLNDTIITPIAKKDGRRSDKKQPKKATRKAGKARKQAAKAKPKPGEPSAPTSYKKGSIQSANRFVTRAYKKKNDELAVKVEELLPTGINLFNADEVQDASRLASFNKKTYRSATKKKSDIKNDPFQNPPFTC